MSSKRILGIAGAAIIGTLAEVGTVHAVLSSDRTGATYGKSITFARESLSKASNRTYTPSGGTKKYYEVAEGTSGSNELVVNVPVGIIVPVSTSTIIQSAVVTVRLSNLVLTDVAPDLSVTDDDDTAITGVTVSVASGGGSGDSSVQFQVSTGTANAIAKDHRLVIDFQRFGFDPDVNSGSITIEARREVAGVPISSTVTLTDAIKMAYALRSVATSTQQTASVEEMFQKFKATDPASGPERDGVGAEGLAANVGSLHIGLATTTDTYLNQFHSAQRGTVGIVQASDLVSAASVTFTGDTSFLAEEEGDDAKKMVYVTTEQDCDPATTSIVDDDGALKASLGSFDDYAGDHDSTTGPADNRKAVPGYLCLKVDGETSIPVTDPYQASITYTSVLADNAVSLPSSGSHVLGGITRDGSNVRIAYLTTNQKYNQRLVLVNRSSSPVEYSMTFQTAEGTTATAGDRASGMLPVGRTVLDVRDDVVTFDNGGNGGHGSAELVAVISSRMIDVATVTTTRADGSTDTVVLDAQ